MEYHDLVGRVLYNSTSYCYLHILGTGDILVVNKKDLEKV
jgi:hypothetical protein